MEDPNQVQHAAENHLKLSKKPKPIAQNSIHAQGSDSNNPTEAISANATAI